MSTNRPRPQTPGDATDPDQPRRTPVRPDGPRVPTVKPWWPGINNNPVINPRRRRR
jgi:hypothetical protein